MLAIALGSYLALFQRSYDFSTRLLNEDKARQLAQTGLEEALWALNQNDWTSAGSANNSVWSTSGSDRTVTLTYSSLGQGASGQLAITVANCASTGPVWPTITSTATITLNDGRTTTKTLQGTTGPASLFGNALASANAYVSFSGGGTVDSWNSDPDNNSTTAAVAYSFNSSDPTCYSAVIAGKDDGTEGVVLNRAAVYGYVATFGQPVSYSSSGMPPAKVKGPATSVSVDVDSTRLGKSAFIPASSVFQITTPNLSGSNFGGVLGSILALVNQLLTDPTSKDVYKVSGDLTILGIPLLFPNLTVDRPLTLIVDGNLTIGGAGKITITSTGSLEILAAGDVTIGGNGIDNQTKDPRKAAIFCTNASTTNSLQYTTSASFYGVIYSENKPIEIQQNATLYGALLSGQHVAFNGSASAPIFHYDTSLRNVRFKNVTTPYVITRLTEP